MGYEMGYGHGMGYGIWDMGYGIWIWDGIWDNGIWWDDLKKILVQLFSLFMSPSFHDFPYKKLKPLYKKRAV
ncbi:hypothetical protein RhiirA4_480558 [Rhizophagus irregularis]|uniref:Uncharacterized protein n=1 Tax=Rhizophagus irregularis TaxID=588596 RepID=A0A2I1HI60_9GLOM|nr:hypothetical protein RhiirA4_480558 [Rhizophagus irregularis]